MRVEALVFLGVGAFVVVVAAVYWFLSYEDAGSVMLLLSGVLGLMIGGWILLQQRGVAEPSDRDAAPDEVGRTGEPEDLYLPHASVWPFAVGVAALVVANGIALGLWALVPGGLLAAGGIYGWARQSRDRA